MRRSRPLFALVVLAALVAGCGGGSGSTEDESTSRQQLENAGQKLTDADSFEVSLLIEGEEEDEESEELGCVRLGVDNRKPVSIDMRIYDLNCSGGTEGAELIAIGNRAWASTDSGTWTAAKISPKLTKELNDEQTTDLKGLFKAAEDIDEVSADDAVEERAAGGEAKAEFSFKAPASAFPGSEALGDSDVDFEATIDDKGFLTQLVLHGEAEGAGATATETYERIDKPLGISPPAASEVHGTVQKLDSKEELEALLGAAF
ncbi:MAG TPA: hypothetical protein VGC32_11930 [Solirubrobacterales bacterium]